MAQGWGTWRGRDRDPPAWLRGGVRGGGGIVIHQHGSGVGYAEGGGIVIHQHGSGVGYVEGEGS